MDTKKKGLKERKNKKKPKETSRKQISAEEDEPISYSQEGITTKPPPAVSSSSTNVLKPVVAFKVEDELFPDEKKDESRRGKGTFQHLKRRTRRFDLQDCLKGSDPFFHVDVGTECETFYQAQRVRVQDRKTEHFAFIVDLDAYEYHKIVFHSFLNEVIQSPVFRFSILLLVILNAILIGLNTVGPLVEEFAVYFHATDHIILSIFVFEILIKWVYDFRLFWKVMWNIMDFLIVLLIIVAAVIPWLSNRKFFVVVRVVRAFRSLRSVSFLSSLTVVTHTIMKSALDMSNILLVLMIFMTVLAVMGVIMFEVKELETEKFLGVFEAWFVIFICVTQDGWNQVLDLHRQPEAWFPAIAIYLIFSVSIGAFVFANLIVAVIVANLELSVKELKAEREQEENPLEDQGKGSNSLDVSPVYDLLCKHNTYLLGQRPLRIPNLKKFSHRRIQAYITLIVALEQNMLEADVIRIDLEKIMAVLLTVVFQLEMYSQQKGQLQEKMKTTEEVMEAARQIDPALTIPELPEDAFDVSNRRLEFLQRLKNRKSADDLRSNNSSNQLLSLLRQNQDLEQKGSKL